jgi:hypothetical protein
MTTSDALFLTELAENLNDTKRLIYNLFVREYYSVLISKMQVPESNNIFNTLNGKIARLKNEIKSKKGNKSKKENKSKNEPSYNPEDGNNGFMLNPKFSTPDEINYPLMKLYEHIAALLAAGVFIKQGKNQNYSQKDIVQFINFFIHKFGLNITLDIKKYKFFQNYVNREKISYLCEDIKGYKRPERITTKSIALINAINNLDMMIEKIK